MRDLRISGLSAALGADRASLTINCSVTPRVLLTDGMGLGQTIQAIGALCVPLRGGAPGPAPSKPALIVAPAGLVLQWRRPLRG